ncbi:MAG TPA: MFS transporter [Acidimicrobiales bacterium]
MSISTAFSSLKIRNYRRYFAGQVLSLCGTWAQTIGLGWLVLRLSHNSGVAVGLATALQFVPVLLFGLWAGLLADRFDKRRFIIGTQVSLASIAALLAVVDLTGVVTLWMVYVFAFVFGMATAADTPARLSFVVEMVGPRDLPNALGLNSAVVNAGRIIGPAIAGIVIAAGGTGFCFVVNAVSYVGTIAAVSSMRRGDLRQPSPVVRGRGQVRAGVRYTWRMPLLRSNILLLGLVSVVAFNFPVILPLLAKLTFRGDASTYSLMASAMGIGALVSALVIASIRRPHGRRLAIAVLGLGLAMCLGAMAPTLTTFLLLMPLIGAGQVVAASTSNAMIQLDSDPAMRGRVTAIFSLASQGLTPAGSLLCGVVAQAAGARWGMAMGGIGALLAVGIFGLPLLRNRGPETDKLPGAEAEVAVQPMAEPGPPPGASALPG